MSDLIDRHEAIRDIRLMDVCVIYDDMCSTEEAVEKAIVATKSNAIFGLECMPSAQPRKKGKWLRCGNHHLCSECDEWALTRWDEDECDEVDILTDYCPNCGADMRGDSK